MCTEYPAGDNLFHWLWYNFKHGWHYMEESREVMNPNLQLAQVSQVSWLILMSTLHYVNPGLFRGIAG